ncbi:hypothetical protein AAW29_00904 [Arcobacter porcinus]|uniref:HTH cro/C1-type domain-containing protein n=2 Tax=Arcobacter porcinus TaxID=1935204 RepID=A0ABX2YDD3_9BACT|nr:hypothetical protein AAW29_00904 [Arcobacter porcinus]OCL92629.1 hypothetical protein AAX28_00164 [Arcobacter porcinus]
MLIRKIVCEFYLYFLCTKIRTMKLTQQDIARIINVTPMTLRNWKKNKPRLYEIIQKGFAFEEVVKKAQENADELKNLEEKFNNKK